MAKRGKKSLSHAPPRLQLVAAMDSRRNSILLGFEDPVAALGGKIPYWWLGLDSRKETPLVWASAGHHEGRAGWKNGPLTGERWVELDGLENQGGLRKGWRKREKVGRVLERQTEASRPRVRKKLRPTGKMDQRGVGCMGREKGKGLGQLRRRGPREF
jgi:hypothetical protein